MWYYIKFAGKLILAILPLILIAVWFRVNDAPPEQQGLVSGLVAVAIIFIGVFITARENNNINKKEPK